MDLVVECETEHSISVISVLEFSHPKKTPRF